MNSNKIAWSPSSWHSRPAAQQPPWPDKAALAQARTELATRLPLVFSGEIERLRTRLARAAAGECFLLQGGDCAERFQTGFDEIENMLKLLMQMAVVLMYAGGRPVIKLGRFAGQYAKPRSKPTEVLDGVDLPSYFGDIVNRPETSPAARRPDPANLLEAASRSAAVLNIIRGLSSGGFADLRQVHGWTRAFVADSPAGRRFTELADGISASLGFMEACGIRSGETGGTEFYTSHEALLLDYEEGLTRQDPESGRWYDTSAHLLWIGERTRQPEGAHVAFLSGIANPLGVKLGPAVTPDELVILADRLNPDNTPGRLTLIVRHGADRIAHTLPPLVERLRHEGRAVLWSIDPMHENTIKTPEGYKTRDFAAVLREVRAFFAVHRALGTVPGGLHLELTGEAVTECLGGGENLTSARLAENYRTACDPRLNWKQALELAFLAAGELAG